jgi:hypothetical protein
MTIKFSTVLYTLGFASIVVSAINYVEGLQSQPGKKGDKQRDGLFTGHWAPTFFILGKVVEDRERRQATLDA